MPTNQDKIFTATDVMALQEELGKGIKVIGEQYKSIQEHLTSIDKKIEVLPDIQHDIAIMKSDIRDILEKKADKKELQVVKERVTVLEHKFSPA